MNVRINPQTVLPQVKNDSSNMSVYSTTTSNYYYSKKSDDFPMVSLNSYNIVQVLLPLAPYCKGKKNERTILRQAFIRFNSSDYKIFIRFCKYDTRTSKQLDCLPKCFILTINGESLQIKTKYSGNPYEISRLFHTKKTNVFLRVEITDSFDQALPFHYGIVAVKKVDLRHLVKSLPRAPSDCFSTINKVKKLLQHDDDLLLEGGEENNKVTVSLRCPFSSARLVNPARSKNCKHVACFDLQAFIEMNEASSKWRCPHCREYVVVADLIIDGLLVRILEDAPKNAKEAYIDITGSYTYDVKKEPVISVIPAKVKRENISPETVPPPKKSKIEIECITIDDSEDEQDSQNQSSSSTASNRSYNPKRFNPANLPSSSSSSESSESDTSSEDDCEIVFEKRPIPRIEKNRLRTCVQASQPSYHLPSNPPTNLSITSNTIITQSGSNLIALNSQVSCHNAYKPYKDSHGGELKSTAHNLNSNVNSSSVRYYHEYPSPQSLPMPHPTYPNQPNIPQYSYGRQVPPYNDYAFRNTLNTETDRLFDRAAIHSNNNQPNFPSEHYSNPAYSIHHAQLFNTLNNYFRSPIERNFNP